MLLGAVSCIHAVRLPFWGMWDQGGFAVCGRKDFKMSQRCHCQRKSSCHAGQLAERGE